MAGADTQLRDEIIPFLGERAVTLFAFSVADGFPCSEVAAPLRAEIVSSGDDPLDPQVTEAERLLIDWGRLLGSGAAAGSGGPGGGPDLDERVGETFQPRLRELLVAYADAIRERCADADRG